NSLPEFWQTCLADRFTYDPSLAQEAEFSWKEPPRDSRGRVHIERAATTNHNTADADRQVFHVGSGISAPRATFVPEPEFSQVARYEKFQGVVVLSIIVGADGRVHDVRIMRPLGLGQEETALTAVQTWRFAPSMREGKPVAVEMNIEVAYNLY